MMKFIHKLTIVLALGGICGLAACSDDDQGFLKRNLREMSFPYVESSDTFTIRATGDWQISDAPDSREWTNAYGWVHVDQLSGKGDPGTYQKVTVTCDQNTSEERSATIYLHGCGEENVAIAIRQDNGIFEWKPFDNGQQFDVSGMLKLNAEAGAKLRIPYIKALGTEKYTVTVTQTGGDGITAASGSYSISTAGNGYIEVPLTGTATKQGIVTFGVKATDEAGTEKDFGSVSTIVRAGFDAQGEELPLLTQNFGKFPWGGDCIGQKAGVTTADKTVANLSLDNETVSVSAGTNASIGGITSTVRNGNAAFYRAIGMEGWTGYLNYMCPGYIQLGAASDNADGQPGNLISPVLNIPAGYYPPSSNRGTYAAASGDNPSGFSATRCTANEFDVFSGGGVAAPYTEGTGLAAWGKSGNIAGRPGYVKMGAGSAAASLYTPELTALPDAATVKVRFSAQAYSEKYDGSGADAGKILVKAVRGAVLGAKGAITGTVTEVSAADPVDISAAKARFREFEATLTNVTPDCRIVISTSEKRALLDNVVVTCTAITPATKPAAPGGVSFDAAAAADRLTLKWNAVPDATSYTVAYWKGSASAPESEYAYKTGIASTATSQELTNLESNTSYWAKVKAVGSLDSDWSETANATTMDSGGEPLLPTADLLDVVFRNDGSAMDNSSSATPVRRMPSSRP